MNHHLLGVDFHMLEYFVRFDLEKKNLLTKIYLFIVNLPFEYVCGKENKFEHALF